MSEPDAKQQAHNIGPRGRESGELRTACEWLVISIVALTAISLAAAHAPPRIRLLGLFAIGYGVLAGAAMGFLAQALQLKSGRFTIAVAVVLIAVGGCGVIGESRRVYAAKLLEEYGGTPQRQIKPGDKALSGPGALGFLGSATEKMKEERMELWREKTRLTSYLQRRLSPLGELSVAMSIAFTLSEILIGTVAGAWVFRRWWNTASLESHRESPIE